MCYIVKGIIKFIDIKCFVLYISPLKHIIHCIKSWEPLNNSIQSSKATTLILTKNIFKTNRKWIYPCPFIVKLVDKKNKCRKSINFSHFRFCRRLQILNVCFFQFRIFCDFSCIFLVFWFNKYLIWNKITIFVDYKLWRFVFILGMKIKNIYYTMYLFIFNLGIT